MRRAPDTALEAFLDELVTGLAAPHHPGLLVAVGWGTVELERAAATFRTRFPSLAPFEPAADDVLLGARALVSRRTGRVPAWLLLLEPNTEGRLAAALARSGEGPVAAWHVGAAGSAAPVTDGLPAPRPTSAIAAGPLGPERLVVGGPRGGPSVLLLERAPGTIER